MDRIIILLLISLIMFSLTALLPDSLAETGASSTLAFGFIILSSYLIAILLKTFKFPKITGYIFAGIIFGPSVLGILSHRVIDDLKLIDDLALTFIAFSAGGELHLDSLRERSRSILLNLFFQIIIIMVGITGSLMFVRSFFPFTTGLPFFQALGIAALCGAIAVARSPSSAIAVISESRARGPFTEMVLGVTVGADVLTVLIFAIVMSLSELAMSASKSIDIIFIFGMILEIIASIVIGVLLGKGIELYLQRIGAELTIFVLSIAFLITKFSQSLAFVLESILSVSFHLEPMLICLTAGFYLQNFSTSGKIFVRVINRSSLPIYVVFFAISGASLKLDALQGTWHWALVLVTLRILFIYISTLLGGYMSSDPPKFIKVGGLGFIAQAGVSLGLAKLIVDRFDEFGIELATLLFATIAINQILGPITFKYALSYVGESKY